MTTAAQTQERSHQEAIERKLTVVGCAAIILALILLLAYRIRLANVAKNTVIDSAAKTLKAKRALDRGASDFKKAVVERANK